MPPEMRRGRDEATAGDPCDFTCGGRPVAVPGRAFGPSLRGAAKSAESTR